MVVATAISQPALVYNTYFASLAIELPTTLTIARVSILFWLAILKVAKESAVSPDCEIIITNVFLSKNNFLYRYSLAISTLTGTSAYFSINTLPTNPAWYALPQATISIFLYFLS